jgi:hypothetical protein
MSTIISGTRLGTSETPDAAGLPAQRAVTRSPDGVLWAVYPDGPGGALQCLRSTDGGGGWKLATQSETLSPVYDASLTIDEEGYADLVYAGEGPRYLYYRKGAPIEGGWDWSIRVRIFDVPALASVNAVAHAEQDEWKIHVVWSRGGEFSSAYYNSLKIDPEREIWLGTRERVGGPFDLPGHPAPSLDMDRTTKRLWAAMWGGANGVVVTDAAYYAGRWKWSGPRPFADSRPVEAGSVSAVWTGQTFAVTYGSDGELVCTTTDGVEMRAPGPAARTSAGVDADGRLHVLYAGGVPGPLYHRTLEGAGWSEADEVHPGPVTSFSSEQHGAGALGAIVATGDGAPYAVEFHQVD